jgi:SAM-dependent methyltransferase
MKPTTSDEILDLLDAFFASAALGAALELGLFWLLEERPLDAAEVAEALEIPPVRCGYWLQLLCATGLIEPGPGGYRPSETARTSILSARSRESWGLLAEEARERMPGLRDLPVHLRNAGSAWEALGLAPAKMYARMAEDPEAARRFTRMLYELHQPLAGFLAESLDLNGVERLMDLGGGSGVVSLALARRHPALVATVVDIASVCAAGREIARENSLQDRVLFHPADLLRDPLPRGFDLVLECDVNVYGEALFAKVRDSLRPGGRFVIVDLLAPAEGVAPSSRIHWAFEGSMIDPGFAFPTAARVRGLLENAGFQVLTEGPLTRRSPAPGRGAGDGWILIESRR